jgi:uncharacterized protein
MSGQMTRLAANYPVVTLTGPRQSGKTTLFKALFIDQPYVNLESIAARNLASADPRWFLAQFPDGAVLDEIQRVPALLSEIQVDVDERRTIGRYILTGSRNFDLMAGISQSLAGRTALLVNLNALSEELGISHNTVKQ